MSVFFIVLLSSLGYIISSSVFAVLYSYVIKEECDNFDNTDIHFCLLWPLTIVGFALYMIPYYFTKSFGYKGKTK